jgi:hypothetical protein
MKVYNNDKANMSRKIDVKLILGVELAIEEN